MMRPESFLRRWRPSASEVKRDAVGIAQHPVLVQQPVRRFS